MRKTIILVVATLAGIATSVGRLSAQSSCGAADSTKVRFLAPYFLDSPEQEAVRTAIGFSPIAETDTQTVVLDETLCSAVVDDVEDRLKGSPIANDIKKDGWTYSVYQFGEYTAMVFEVNPSSDDISLGYATMLIYTGDAKELVFIGSILV